VVDIGVEGEDDSLRRLSERDTGVWPIEGIVSGMMLKYMRHNVQFYKAKTLTRKEDEAQIPSRASEYAVPSGVQSRSLDLRRVECPSQCFEVLCLSA